MQTVVCAACSQLDNMMLNYFNAAIYYVRSGSTDRTKKVVNLINEIRFADGRIY
jgi:hypothetical protein